MRLPITFICITIMLDAMGIGLIMPVMPELLQEVGTVDLSNAARWGGILTVIFVKKRPAHLMVNRPYNVYLATAHIA